MPSPTLLTGSPTSLRSTLAGLLITVLAVTSLSGCSGSGSKIVIGIPKPTTTTAAPGPTIVTDTSAEPPEISTAGHGALLGGLAPADGHPWAPAIEFHSDTPVPSTLVFILVVGSDARPGEDVRRARADSLHLLAVNPSTLEGTVLGIPRDSWVEIPGHGQGKITASLAYGGPDLLSATVRKLTGLPVDYYALTGFAGLPAIVDELGGVDVFVDRRMNDHYSGAAFEPGWHHFTGAQALAYARDRYDQPAGDFDRSRHQGELIRAALAKMRSTVGDDNGIARWTGVLLRHAELDAPLSKLAGLGALARRIDVSRIRNVVAPGRTGSAGGQSVVFLGSEAAALFMDLRDDAVVGSPSAPPTTSTSAPTTTSAPSSSTSSTTTPPPITTPTT